MQPHTAPLLASFLFTLLLAAPSKADDATLKSIQKEREAILVQIVELEQSQRATGSSDALDSLELAQVQLHSFRRDQAKNVADKIPHQELVVEAFEKRYQSYKLSYESGHSVNMNLLKAKEDYLKAKQQLLELKAAS